MKIRSNTGRGLRAGFSLAELMVVIVIIGLLATFVVPNVMSKFTTAQLTKAKADLKTIADAVESYRMDNSARFPDDLEALVTKDDRGTSYLNSDVVPKDPWGNEYVYEPPSGGDSQFYIWCYGRDGVQGGEGEDLDFNNRMVTNGEI
ncbi:MAG: type II secretion system major pseudopilin GspG [Planctomycetota bacterium]